MSASVHLLAKRRRRQSVDRREQRFLGSRRCVERSIRGHDQSNDRNFERVAAFPRWRLGSIADTAQQPICNVKIVETVAEKFLDRERFDQPLVFHDACPRSCEDRHQTTSSAKSKNEIGPYSKIRFRAAPCLVSGSSALLSFDGAQV